MPVRRVFGQLADQVIEATGAARSVIDGLDILRSGGVMVVAGIHSESLTLDLTRFVREKKQLRGAHDTTSHALAESLRLLAENADVLSRLITHRQPLSRALEAFELARSRQAMKVILVPNRMETPNEFNDACCRDADPRRTRCAENCRKTKTCSG